MKLSSSLKIKAFLLLWIVIFGLYLMYAYNLYSQLSIFTTPGSSYMVRLIEFLNFRGYQVVKGLIIYFIIMSIFSFIVISTYRKSCGKKSVLIKILTIYAILSGCLFFVTNIFFPVYLSLTLLSIILINTVFYIYSVYFDTTITFHKNDIIFRSRKYDVQEEAVIGLKKELLKLDNKHHDKIEGIVIENQERYYFEVYALSNVTLDSKGGLLDHDKK